jgi:hypothetical protein
MLKIVIDNYRGQLDMRVTFVCPHCGRRSWFAAAMSILCENCKKEVPNVCSMLRDERERMSYHKRGITRSFDRYMPRSTRWKVPVEEEMNKETKRYLWLG